ncbi:MAG: TolC family outer membrane protein [Inquilinus sp.]|nr:TolC family outer membrane protein [Inquilinus sp.]
MQPTSRRRRVMPVRAAALLAFAWSVAGGAAAATLTEAVQVAIETNPEIALASAGRDVADSELRQAQGRYLPQLDLEAYGGVEWTDSPGTRASGLDNPRTYPDQVSVVLQQLLFDGFATPREVQRQAARTDAAANRVFERAEFIGLEVIQVYLDVMRQMELAELSRANIAVHVQTLSNVRQRQRGGRGSIADVQQAEQRLHAAEATLVDIERALEDARAAYERLVGEPAGAMTRPAPAIGAMPSDVGTAVLEATGNNPALRSARADFNAALAAYRGSAASYYPRVTVESRANFGNDLSGVEGRDDSYDVRVIARYNLFRGGIDRANRQAQLGRVDEARNRVLALERDVEELVRQSWNALDSASRRLDLLDREVAASERVRRSYRQQFNVGQRSLLDLLDSDTELFGTRVARANVDYALIFARYRLLAATGALLGSLGILPPPAAATGP